MIKIVAVFLCVINGCIPFRLAHAAKPLTVNFYSQWSTGCWWVVESDYILSPENNPALPTRTISPSAPNEHSILNLRHRFAVVRESDVAGSKCWVVHVAICGYPEGVKNDTKGKPLWVLYVRKDDGSLARYSWCLRDGPCFITGKVKQEGTRYLKKRLPVVPTVDQQTPLDIPLFNWNAKQLTFIRKTTHQLSFEDEWHEGKQIQRTEILKEIIGAKEIPVAIITISGHEMGLRQQTWKTGYPWWLAWRQIGMNGRLHYGLFRARLLEWGIAGGKKYKVRSNVWW